MDSKPNRKKFWARVAPFVGLAAGSLLFCIGFGMVMATAVTVAVGVGAAVLTAGLLIGIGSYYLDIEGLING